MVRDLCNCFDTREKEDRRKSRRKKRQSIPWKDDDNEEQLMDSDNEEQCAISPDNEQAEETDFDKEKSPEIIISTIKDQQEVMLAMHIM